MASSVYHQLKMLQLGIKTESTQKDKLLKHYFLN